MRWKKSLITIFSLFATLLFIGTAMNEAVAINTDENNLKSQKHCSLCAKTVSESSSNESNGGKGGGCESCKEAVEYAIDYAANRIKEEYSGEEYYLFKYWDIAIDAAKYIIEGIEKSEYNFLKNMAPRNLLYQIGTQIYLSILSLVGKQKHLITLGAAAIIASLIGIGFGVKEYLLSICEKRAGNDSSNSTKIKNNKMIISTSAKQPTTKISKSVSKVQKAISKNILQKNKKEPKTVTSPVETTSIKTKTQTSHTGLSKTTFSTSYNSPLKIISKTTITS